MPNFINYNGNNIEESLKATTSTNGLMSKEDKTKLNSISTGANNYTHPATHPPSIIVQDANNRFVTDVEKASWNAKSGDIDTHINNTSNPHKVTKTQIGLSNLTNDAQVKRSEMGTVSGVATLDTIGKVPITQIPAVITSHLNNTSNPHSVTKTHIGLSNLTNDAQVKRSEMGVASGIATLDTTGKIPSSQLPSTYPATMITEDATHRFATDTEKSTWNAKASTDVVTTTANGLMIATDKVKLNGIATGANNYVHPTNHPASIITQDASNRFVTDVEKAKWNNTSYDYAYDSMTYSYYKKYADGTVDMYGKYTHPLLAPTFSTSGSLLYSDIHYITLPVALVNATEAHISSTVRASHPTFIFVLQGGSPTTTTIPFRIVSSDSSKDFYAEVHWRVTGRWK